ncbi:heme ABC exporter ATP-binding protein CcmA [Geminicoccaceae bacterium 1502E]|nr:heme ABC exporter ATP-binding protein CcmA [Geminicoccaceae bacterium 1502E]
MPSPEPALFAAQALACARGGRLVFEELSFALAPGEALLLRGPNGCGKSSLLRMLAGLLRPAGGRLMWEGEAVAADLPAHHVRLHYVGHGNAIATTLTAEENLAFSTELLGGTGEHLAAALAAFDLEPLASSPGRFLSAGQRRRLALARLVAAPRKLWLLDEPGVGLDRASRARLEAAIGAHRAAGGICVLATHGDVAVSDPLVIDFHG